MKLFKVSLTKLVPGCNLLTTGYYTNSIADGLGLLVARIPFECASRVLGTHRIERPQVVDVHPPTKRACLPPGTRYNLLDGGRRDQYGSSDDCWQRKPSADSRVNVCKYGIESVYVQFQS